MSPNTTPAKTALREINIMTAFPHTFCTCTYHQETINTEMNAIFLYTFCTHVYNQETVKAEMESFGSNVSACAFMQASR